VNTRQLAGAACRLEGKKSQVKSGDMLEAISCIGYVLLLMSNEERQTTLDNILKAGLNKLNKLKK
jgi:hypothetical protein